MECWKKTISGCIVFIALLGIFLRLKAFGINASFWHDESSLFNAFIDKSCLDMFSAFSTSQSAPPLFLIIEKFVVFLLGTDEYALRLFPMICSLCSVPVFYMFSKIFLKSNFALIIANLLFAANCTLIHFAQQFKQYSSDVLLFLILFVILNNMSIKAFGKKEFLYYVMISCIFPLISLPAYFVLGGWFIRELTLCGKNNIKKLLAVNIPCLFISVIYCVTTLIPQSHTLKWLFNYWQDGFISFNIVQNTNLLMTNLKYFFGTCTNSYILICVLLFCGIIMLVKNFREKENILLFCTIAIILLFSALHIYPLYGRVCLYSIPIVIILITKICDYALIKNKLRFAAISVIFIFLLSDCRLHYIIKDYVPQNIGNARILMLLMMDFYQPDRTVIVTRGSYPDYLYYRRAYYFYPEKEIILPNKQSKEEFTNEIEKNTEKGKSYLLYCTFMRENYEKDTIKEWSERNKIKFNKDFNYSYMSLVEKL